MGEIVIKPIQNVHKKYREMNLVNHYIFTPPVDISTNTYIGGVASTISTPALLASKIGLNVSLISNFSIVGSDIKCKINSNYIGISNAFSGNSDITYYNDSEGKCLNMVDGFISGCANSKWVNFPKLQSINGSTFNSLPNMSSLEFPELLTSIGTFSNMSGNIKLRKIELPKATSIKHTNEDFANGCSELNFLYIPLVTELGMTHGRNGAMFLGSNLNNLKIYANPFLQTSNAGAEDGDLAFARSSGATIVYVTNFTAPSPITTLSAGTIYNTAVQLNFTAPSSANAIDHYDLYVNGVFNKKINSGEYVNGLTENTSYNMTLYAYDVFYNRSLVSNALVISTSNYAYTDADANAYISASGLALSEKESAYRLIVDLKSNSLYTKCQSIYLFKGTTASQHKFNAKNPVDTDAGYRLVFTGSATFSNLGYQLNSNSYANTKFTPSLIQNVNSNGITISIGTNNAVVGTDSWDAGAFSSGTQASLLTSKSQNSNFAVLAGFNTTTYASRTGVNDAKGVITGTKTASNIHKLIKNGVVLATSTGGGTLPSIPIYIGTINVNNLPNGSYSPQRVQIVIFHEGLSDSETATLHSIINISELIAGRKTW